MLSLPFDAVVQIELRVIVEQIRSLNKSIAEREKTIPEEASKLEGHKSLIGIKGIGKITSAVLLSVIGDISDFPGESRLASYFGIVTRVANSNETERSGHIHRGGSKLGRNRFDPVSPHRRQLQSRSQEFLSASESPARRWRKPSSLNPRKFLGIIYRTLKNNWVFEDFPNFVLAEPVEAA